jgi:hypothetical protein
MLDFLARYSSRFTVLVLAVASLFPLVTAYRYPAYLNDDSYITLTYAKNLAQGNGFVFNHAPAVLGTTTPLFTFVVAGASWIVPDVDLAALAVFVSAFCWLGIVGVFFFFRKAWNLVDWQAGIVGLVVIASGWVGFLGMEAYPFAFLLVLSLSLFLRERDGLAGFVTGLLFLTRGEGVLVLAVLVIATGFQAWRKGGSVDRNLLHRMLKIVLGFSLPVLVWAIYAYSTFGSLLPHTLAAKQAQGQSDLWRSFPTRLLSEWVPSWGRSFAVQALPFINVWWLVVLIGLADSVLRRRQWLLFVGWISLYILGYTILDVSAYWWYQLPILFVLTLLFGLGLVRSVELLFKHIRRRTLALGLSTILVVVLLLAMAIPTVRATLRYTGDPRGESYTVLGRWFRDHTAASDSVAFIEIGYLGYYADNRIVDLTGLVTPDITPHVGEGDFAWGFWQYQPDYYVSLPDFDWALASIMADPRFAQQYQPVATLPGPRETDFVIYQRTSQ